MIYHLKAYGLLFPIKYAVTILELLPGCQVAMETCILAFWGILVICILFRHFLIFPQRVVHGVVD